MLCAVIQCWRRKGLSELFGLVSWGVFPSALVHEPRCVIYCSLPKSCSVQIKCEAVFAVRSVKSLVDVQPLDCPQWNRDHFFLSITNTKVMTPVNKPSVLICCAHHFLLAPALFCYVWGVLLHQEMLGLDSLRLQVAQHHWWYWEMTTFIPGKILPHKNSVSCSPVWGGVPWGRVSAERAFILSSGAGTDWQSVFLNGFTSSFPLEIPFWNADFSSPHTLTFFSLLSSNWGLIPAHCSTSRCDSAKWIVFKCFNSLKMRTCKL